MEESADGTIVVVELDPTKHHLLIIEPGALFNAPVSLVDGVILIKRRGVKMTIVEGDSLPEIRSA